MQIRVILLTLFSSSLYALKLANKSRYLLFFDNNSVALLTCWHLIADIDQVHFLAVLN